MNDTKKEELKVLIDNDGFITLDQILTILESIDFMYRVLYRHELKLPYNYRLAEDKKLQLSQLSSEKSFEFLFSKRGLFQPTNLWYFVWHNGIAEKGGGS